MTYRVTENINLPFKVTPNIKENGKKIEAEITLKAIFDRSIFATNVTLKMPCPKNTATTSNIYAGIGRAKYEPESGGIVWRIKKFDGDTTANLSCVIELTNDKPWTRPPISMEF